MRAFAGLAGLIGLGALVAGLVDPLPEPARVLASLAILFVLPPCLLSSSMRGILGLRARGPLRFAAPFVVWLCVLCVWSSAFTAAGTSFRVFALATIWALLALFAVSAFRALRRARADEDAGDRRDGRGWWIVLVACALFAALYPPVMSVSEDALDHAGYVRHILTDNSLEPGGVLALAAGETVPPPDPRKGALHPLFALASWISSAEPLALWRWLTVVTFPAVAAALLAFNDAFLRSRRARIAVACLVLLTFDGNPFRLAAASPHGESLAAMWAWVLGAMALSGVSAPPRWYAWTLLAAGGVLAHLGVAWHAGVLAATVLVLGGAWGIPRRARITCGAALMAGVTLALLLRHEDLAGPANIIHAHTQGVMFLTERWFVASPMEILRQQGMIFLGGLVLVPMLALRARRDISARAMVAAAAIPFAVSFVPWIATWAHEHASYMVFRSLLQVPALAAIVVSAGALLAGARRRDRGAILLGVPAAALWLLVFLRPVPAALLNDARNASTARVETVQGVDAGVVRAIAGLPTGSVVLTDPATAYVLSAHTSQRFVVVYGQHGNPRDPLALDRIQAVRNVLSPFVLADLAAAACRRFQVDYVLVNSTPPAGASTFLSAWNPSTYDLSVERLDSFGSAFTPMESPRGTRLFRVEPGAVINRAWSTSEMPVVVASPPLAPCPGMSPSHAFEISGVSVEPAGALPGDTLRVTLGYHRDSSSRFSLPEIIHVRFDHELLDAGPVFPGEKQWRRFVDGRAGALSRFRADMRPGHGVYEPDLWPVGFDLCETFPVVVPLRARAGEYQVEVSVERETQVPNFHVRDLFFNRDHYSGTACATVTVAGTPATEARR